jgi:glycosidase
MLHRLNRLGLLLPLLLPLTTHCRTPAEPDASSPTGLTGSSELPDISQVGVEAVVRWSKTRLGEAEADFSRRGTPRLPSPSFWGGEVVYQIMVDRFNDGDTANDFAVVSSTQKAARNERYRRLGEYHHGGDLEGVADRLDYLADLGITAIWLTPVLMNANGAYHGYCTTDFTQLDPNYGTKEELAALVAAAHERGIRIILDLVVNHMCDSQTRYVAKHRQDEHTACAEDLDQNNRNGRPSESRHQKELAFSPSFFPPFKLQHFFNRCGANSQAEMEGHAATSVYGDFTEEMLDFDTRNYDFQRIFTNLMKYWIAYADIDGFRMDAVKHTTPDFTAYFATEVRDYARSLGKSHFYVVAEIAGDSATIARHLGRMNTEQSDASLRERLVHAPAGDEKSSVAAVARRHPEHPWPGTTGVYDFAHSGIARDVLTQKRPSRALENYFRFDSYYQDLKGQGDPRLNFTLVEIHDWERLNVESPDDVSLSSLALSYLATAPGIPIIYYGAEQGFNSHCRRGKISPEIDRGDIEYACFRAEGPDKHPRFRQDMFLSGMFRLGSSVPKIDALASIGPPQQTPSPRWQDDPFLDRSHSLYQTTRRFLRLRRSCHALRYGDIAWRWVSEQPGGLLAFSRLDHDKEALVVGNLQSGEVALPDLTVSRSGVEFVNLARPTQVARPSGEGRISFQGLKIPGRSIMVFVPRTSLGRRAEELGTNLCGDEAR